MSNYIFIDNLSFSYPGSSVSLFENLSLKIYEGWTTFSGANGSGKSTLKELIASNLVPDKGHVRTSGEVCICDQVFDGLSDDDAFYIYDGSKDNMRLMRNLGITDEMLLFPENLSGGEKKRIQLLSGLSRHPSILILDEPTNHLDRHNRDIIIRTLKDFDGCGIIITHDRALSDALSERTILFERGTQNPAALSDFPLSLSPALEERRKERESQRASYFEISNRIKSTKEAIQHIKEKNQEKAKALSKAGLDKNDHSAKAKVDGARLTGKDRSLSGKLKRMEGSEKRLEKKQNVIGSPLMRKEGLCLNAKSSYLPPISIGPWKISVDGLEVTVPEFTLNPGEKLAITGENGTGKTLLMNRIRKSLEEKEADLLYIAQEYSSKDIARIREEFSLLSDDEKGGVISDMYRLMSNPSFLLGSDIAPSPGELKKLDFILSRRKGKNIIMMDEITNHLDIESVMMFENMLKEEDSFTLILVSHDEEFIKRTCGRVILIERDGGKSRAREISPAP